MNRRDHHSILVIDDDESIRESIVGYLEDRLYTVSEAINGTAGLEYIAENNPDLILCDLRMPEIDGLEVLRRIAEDGNDTPVIVVSGTGEISDTVQALRLGAVDFIMKPIRDMDLLTHAVDNALEKKRLIGERKRYQRELEKTNQQLKETLNRYELTRETLLETKKMAALGNLVAGIAHEINTPIGTALTASTFLEDTTSQLETGDIPRKCEDPALKEYIETVRSISSTLITSMNKAANLIHAFKQIAVDHHFENKREFDLVPYIQEIILGLKQQYGKTTIEIESSKDDSFVMESYPGALSVILGNLVDNSFSHGFKKLEKGTIRIKMKRNGDTIAITYEDDGRGMDEQIRSRVFDPFFTTKRDEGPGLGLSIVYNMVTQKLGGSIRLESSPGSGVKFLMEVPAVIEE